MAIMTVDARQVLLVVRPGMPDGGGGQAGTLNCTARNAWWRWCSVVVVGGRWAHWGAAGGPVSPSLTSSSRPPAPWAWCRTSHPRPAGSSSRTDCCPRGTFSPASSAILTGSSGTAQEQRRLEAEKCCKCITSGEVRHLESSMTKYAMCAKSGDLN